MKMKIEPIKLMKEIAPGVAQIKQHIVTLIKRQKNLAHYPKVCAFPLPRAACCLRCVRLDMDMDMDMDMAMDMEMDMDMDMDM